MTKLESRPRPGTDFQYMFYMDVEASVYSPDVIDLLCEMDNDMEEFVSVSYTHLDVYKRQSRSSLFLKTWT